MSTMLLRETIRSTIMSLLQENQELSAALKQAFLKKDKQSIEYAAKACLKSGLPRAKCDDAIKSFIEQTNDEDANDVAQSIEAILEDPENWHAFGHQTNREKTIGKLNI